jgi:hypothetical protein
MSTGSSERAARWALVLVALPPATVAAGAIILVALGLVGWNPFWSDAHFTMAEAAAMRDQATVAALARAGVDPSARMRVRAGVFDERLGDLEMTPAEAAVRADRPEILDVLFANGLRLETRDVHELICSARQWQSEDVLTHLSARFPEAIGPCTDGSRLE